MKTTPECSANRNVIPALKEKSDTLYIMYNLGGTAEIISSLVFKTRDVFYLEEYYEDYLQRRNRNRVP